MREVMLCEQLPTMPVVILPSDLESIDARVSHLNVIGMEDHAPAYWNGN